MSQPAEPTPSSKQAQTQQLTVGQFAERFRGSMIPLSGGFSYFCDSSLPFTEEDSRDYLEEPVAALPPVIFAQLPRISILIVPYLSREKAEKPLVSMVAPPKDKFSWTAQVRTGQETVLAFTFTGHDVSEYHYRFYQHIAGMVWGSTTGEEVRARYSALIAEEFGAGIHGEVDEESWRLKQQLTRRNTKVRPDSKVFTDYVQASFVDTMTLFLHGICCDIDVDTGPRQLPSRMLRKRLKLLKEFFPPPADYFVLPEDIKNN